MKIFWFSVLLYLLLSQDIYGQALSIQTINAGGGTERALLQDISIEWSAGEVFANLYLTSNYIFSEGFQQFQVSDALTTAHQTELDQINIFPNPFSEHIDIRRPIELVKSSRKLTIDLYSSSGSHIFKDIVLEEDQTLDTSLLNPGLYFLSVKDNHNVLQVEKLIKAR